MRGVRVLLGFGDALGRSCVLAQREHQCGAAREHVGGRGVRKRVQRERLGERGGDVLAIAELEPELGLHAARVRGGDTSPAAAAVARARSAEASAISSPPISCAAWPRL